MSLIAGLLRAALPVGSARRDALVSVARKAGVVPAAPESSYQRWISSFESDADEPLTEAAISGGSPPSPVRSDVQFDIVVHPGTTNPAAITRTLVSLVNQSYAHWVARLPDSTGIALASSKRVLADAMQGEARFTTRPGSDASPTAQVFRLEISLGDALAPTALTRLAAAADRHPAATMISAEFDMIDPFSGRRTAPASVGHWEPDLAQQFDLGSGCVARRIDARNAGIPGQLDASRTPHVNAVLLHRLVGPRARASTLLLPAPSPNAAASSRRNGGTRVRHGVTPGTTAVVVVRDPLTDPVAAQRHLAMLMKTAGTQVEVLHTRSWTTGETMGQLPEADVVLIIDGGLSPQEAGWLGDLVGVLQQPHVFAVSPLVLAPSGVVFDGGVNCGSDGLAARSGRCDLAPFELERCRQVHSLSGRAMAIRYPDFLPLSGRNSATGITPALAAAAEQQGRCCLVWAHQRWVLNRGIAARSTDSPMLAWSSGRLRSWFDPGVTPHRPEPGRAGEGVW